MFYSYFLTLYKHKLKISFLRPTSKSKKVQDTKNTSISKLLRKKSCRLQIKYFNL